MIGPHPHVIEWCQKCQETHCTRCCGSRACCGQLNPDLCPHFESDLA